MVWICASSARVKDMVEGLGGEIGEGVRTDTVAQRHVGPELTRRFDNILLQERQADWLGNGDGVSEDQFLLTADSVVCCGFHNRV